MRTGLRALRKRISAAIPLSGLLQDYKLGWRRTIRTPGFSAVAVLSLALAIGGNTVLFSLMAGSILRAPPYKDPEELVDIHSYRANIPYGTLSYPAFRQLEGTAGEVFAGMAAAMVNTAHLSDGRGRHDDPLHQLVAGPFFQVLGVDAHIGRVFDPDEGMEVGADPVVVLSHDYWSDWFDGDPGVIGRTVWLNETPFTIVGVAPPGFYGLVRGIDSAFWAHVSMGGRLSLLGSSLLESHEREFLFVVGRLAEGKSVADAQTVAGAFADSLFAADPDIYRNHRIEVAPVLASSFAPKTASLVIPVAAMATGVLAILLSLACLNLATVLMARTQERRHELAIRLALGTRRRRLVRSLLTETTILSLLGGSAGMYVSVLLMETLSNIDVPRATPFPVEASLRIDVLLFAFGLSLLAGLLMGLGTAIRSTQPGIAAMLKEEHVGGTAGARRVHAALLVAQVALTTMLTVAAAGCVRSFVTAQRVDPGFGKHPVAVAFLAPGPSRTEPERRAFYDAYLQRVTDIPGIASAGLSIGIPLQTSPLYNLRVNIPGVDPPKGRDTHAVEWAAVEGDYFDAMGIPLLAGRSFDAGDSAGAPVSAVASESMAARFWPGQDPVGQKFTVCEDCWVTVVGVVGDTRARTLFEAPAPIIYTRMAQSPYFHARVFARTTGDPTQVLPPILEAGRQLDSAVIILDGRTMEQVISYHLFPLRVSFILAGTISAFAVFLAIIGVYGVVTYTVAARKREMMIRMSLGANPSLLVVSVLRVMAKLVGIGVVIGLMLAGAGAHILENAPSGVGPLAPVDFAGSAILLAGIAILATWLSARRAIRLEPAQVLRQSAHRG